MSIRTPRVGPPGGWSLPRLPGAACRTVDPEIFFPDVGQNAHVALAVCARCPVLAECRQWALSTTEDLSGVWGGLTEMERAYLNRRRPECGTPQGWTLHKQAREKPCPVCQRGRRLELAKREARRAVAAAAARRRRAAVAMAVTESVPEPTALGA